MKLYEINDAIETLLSALTVDPETGEIPVDADEIVDRLDELSMERQNVLEYLAKTIINLRADQDAIKAEEKRLKDRRDAMAKREQAIMNVLDRECKGEKTDLGVATVSYRKSETVDFDPDRNNVAHIVLWLAQNSLFDCYKNPDPVLDKTALKKLIKSGTEVPGVTISVHDNCSLK